MVIDTQNLKEIYVPKKKIVANDERFYAVPETSERYALSTYGRLFRMDKNGIYKKVKPAYEHGKDIYSIRYDGIRRKQKVNIQRLIKDVFYPLNVDGFLWNPHSDPFNKRQWKVDDLEILYGREQIVEAIQSKIEGKEAEYGDSLNEHGFINRQEFDRPLNTVAHQVYENMRSRCKNENVKTQNPIYKDAELCKEWDDNPDSFYQWFIDNTYYYPGTLCIDKDIFNFGEKALYSPETCCFIPYYLNNIFQKNYSELGYSIQEKMRTTGEKYYIVPAGAFVRDKSNKKVITCDTYKECLQAGRKKKANYIREIVKEERSNGYIPENILEAMEEWANRCELGLLKAWEPDPDKLRKRGVI